MNKTESAAPITEWPEWVQVLHWKKETTKRMNTTYECSFNGCKYNSRRKQDMAYHITTHQEKMPKEKKSEESLWKSASAGKKSFINIQ